MFANDHCLKVGKGDLKNDQNLNKQRIHNSGSFHGD